MEHPGIRRVRELLRLAARAWWLLVISFLFGVLELAEIANGASRHLYTLGALAAFTFIAVLVWVAYQALKQRDEARSEAEAARDDLRQRPPREGPDSIPPLQLPPVPHEVRHTEEGRTIIRPITDEEAKEIES